MIPNEELRRRRVLGRDLSEEGIREVCDAAIEARAQFAKLAEACRAALSFIRYWHGSPSSEGRAVLGIIEAALSPTASQAAEEWRAMRARVERDGASVAAVLGVLKEWAKLMASQIDPPSDAPKVMALYEAIVDATGLRERAEALLTCEARVAELEALPQTRRAKAAIALSEFIMSRPYARHAARSAGGDAQVDAFREADAAFEKGGSDAK